MKQAKQFLRPLLMAIVMMVGMLVPQGAWAITFLTEEGDDFGCEDMDEALNNLTELRGMGYHVTTMCFDEDIALDEEFDLSLLGQDITIDLHGHVLTNEPGADYMRCIVVFYKECDYRITIQDGTIESNELDAIYFHGYDWNLHQKLILKNVNVVTRQEGRRCLFDAMSGDWVYWGYEGDPDGSPKLQIIDSEFHSNGCSAISFTFQRNDEYVKSILPEGYSFYNANTDVELVEYADRPFVDENGNPATDIRTGVSQDLPIKISNPYGYEVYCGNFKQTMDIYVSYGMTLTLLDDVKEGLCTTNNNCMSVTIDLNGHTLDITHLNTYGGEYLNIIDSSEGKTGKLIAERFYVDTPAENNAVIEGNVITRTNDCFTNNGLVEYVDGGFINNGDFITSWTWADDHSSATLRINHEDVDAVVTNEDTTPATCIASGVRTYTAAAIYRDRNYADTKDEEIAIDPNAHSYTNNTLTAEPDANGLYAYACDRGCGEHNDAHVIKDFNGEGNHLALTTDGEGNYSTSEDITLADANGFVSPVDFTVPSDQVSVSRTFTAEKPASAMLPFTVAASQINGATFYEFKGVTYDTENSEWVATMQNVSSVEAYKPYVVIREGVGDITFGTGSQTVSFPATPDASDMTTTDQETGWTYVALNEFKRWEAGDEEIGKSYGFAGKDKDYDGYSVAKGDFVKIAEGASAKPGRCYLVKNDGEPLAARGMTRTAAADELPATITVRFVNSDDETLGIGTLNTETGEMTLEGWYDLNGRIIEQPSKGGIYIHNNKKAILK